MEILASELECDQESSCRPDAVSKVSEVKLLLMEQ